MNIVIFSWRGPKHPLSGGAEIATFEHAKEWTRVGNKVTLFTSYFEGAKKKETLNGIEIIRRGGDAFGVKLVAPFWYLFGNHSKFDLVVDEFHGIPFFTPVYVRTKKLAFIHELAKEVWWLNPWPKPFNYIPAFFGTLFEPLIFKLLYKNIQFMTVSESTKNDLIEWGIPVGKIKVVHNGVNTIPVNVKKEVRKTAIFLGALAKDKGIEDALRAFSLIDKKDSGWQFWVVGWGAKNYLNVLKALARELKIERKVEFWGFVDDKKKFELLTRAHVFINPSVREGWGLVNIEASSAGTPVVGYNVPGMKDSVISGKTGLLFRLGDYESLAENAIRLCNSARFYATMHKEAIAWAKRFTWERSTKESLNLIKNLVF